MDAGLAKVINSTVGTDDFKSLDKLIYGRQGLVPSENAYFDIGKYENKKATVTVSTTEKSSYSDEPIVSLKMWTDGGFSIGATVNYGIASSGYWDIRMYGGIAVFVNGELVKTAYHTSFGELSSYRTGTVKTENIYFSLGDVVEIKPYISGYRTDTGSQTVNLSCELSASTPIVIYADSVEKPFDIIHA